MLQHQRPGHRHRCHRPRQTERRDDRRLPLVRKINDPLRHRDVQLPGRVGVDHGIGPDPRVPIRFRQIQPQPDHRQTLRNLPPAPRIDEHRLVGPGDLRPHHRIMPQAGWHILRLDRWAQNMDHVETLLQRQRFFIVAQRPRPAPARKVGGIGAARPRPEQQLPRRIIALTPRIRRPHPPATWGGRQGRADDVAADEHHIVHHPRPGSGKQTPRFGQQDLHPLALQHAQGGVMQGGHGVVTEHRLRGERMGQVNIVHLAALASGVANARHAVRLGHGPPKTRPFPTLHAVCGTSTFSRIGRWISAENAPTPTPTHQTAV